MLPPRQKVFGISQASVEWYQRIPENTRIAQHAPGNNRFIKNICRGNIFKKRSKGAGSPHFIGFSQERCTNKAWLGSTMQTAKLNFRRTAYSSSL